MVVDRLTLTHCLWSDPVAAAAADDACRKSRRHISFCRLPTPPHAQHSTHRGTLNILTTSLHFKADDPKSTEQSFDFYSSLLIR